MYVNSIRVSPKNISLQPNTWFHAATAEVLPAEAENRTLVWHSENEDIATVNASSGYIYAKAEGEVRIYAAAADGSGCKDYMTVTVLNTIPVDTVAFAYTGITLEKGGHATLVPSVGPENATDKSLLWTCDNDAIATVENGVVTGVGVGTATVTATAADGSGTSASCTVSVTEDVLVKSITVTTATETMEVGASQFMHATIDNEEAANQSVHWTSSDPSVATVNETSGLVYAQSSGSATISAVADDGSGTQGTYALKVAEEVLVGCIFIAGPQYTLTPGASYQMRAEVLPEEATNKQISWISSEPEIVSVSSNGLITAQKMGTAIIVAKALDGGTAASNAVAVIVGQTSHSAIAEAVRTANEITAFNLAFGSILLDPVDLYTGAHLLKNTVMTLSGGQNLQLIAEYDSTRLATGCFGKGWYHNYEKHLEVNGSEILVYSNPSSFARYTATSDCANTWRCETKGKSGYVLTVDETLAYPYMLNCNCERIEYYDKNGELGKIVDHRGFETRVSNSDAETVITDCVSGKSIHIEKEVCNTARVYDDAGRQATFRYSNDMLTSICDVNGNTLTFTYDEEGRVLSGTDAKGIRYFENTYDCYGRVETQKDAITGSVKSTITYDGDTRIVSDRNGNQSTHVFNSDGLLTSYTDANGTTKTYTYDENYNITCETDGKGAAVRKVFNSFNKPTQITDKNGNKTYITYDTCGNAVKIQYPSIGETLREETFAYNSRNQLVEHKDLRGTVTTYTYDDNGMPKTKKIGGKNAQQYSYVNGQLVSQTDAMGNTTRFTHNAIGQMTAKTDAAGETTEYVYDAAGNLLKTIDANGKSIVNTYDCNHQKTSVTDACGHKTEYAYNGNLKNELVTMPDGSTVRYEFDGEDRPIKITDRDNHVTTMEYDKGGRLIAKHFPDGGTVRYEYDAAGNVLKETNPMGAVLTKTYDSAGNVLTVKDNEENTTSYQYNAMSKVTRATNAVSGTITYTYSDAGDLLSETDALGNTKSYTYDAYGNRLTATDARGNVTAYTYDENNNLLTVKDPLNHVTTYAYNVLGQCVSVTDALNNTIRYGYDALGRRTTITDAKNNVFTTTYDGNGNVIKTTDAKGNVISETVYNSLNLPLTVTDAMGKTTTYTYTPGGKTASVTDSMNHRSEYSYNARGQNTAVRDAANGNSTATYDLLGNVTRLAGPLGGATNYTYDVMGRLIAESTASGGTVSYTYNELNVRSTLTNARQQTHRFFYDAKGRITGCITPENSISYTYDAADNVLTVTDSQGTITRTYDALNRVASCTDTAGNLIRYEYDAVGNLSRIIYPDNTAVTYAYDANHNLLTVTDWANRVTGYTYDVNNHVVGVTKPDGSVTTTVYDNMQRITSTVEKTASGTVITGFEYTYDDLSRIVEEKVLDNSTKMCYTYDSLDRVLSRTVKSLSDDTVLSTETYTYDAAGNITDAPDSCFAYDVNNRLVVFNGQNVSYDLDGNMLSNGGLSCTYDSSNRLLTADGHTYTYNAENVRIRNLCAEEDTTYVYDTNGKLSRLLAKTTNGITTKYVYGYGLIGEEVNSSFKTYHFDNRGSTIAITDASGNITDTFAYDTYGKCISHTGTSPVIFGYNGRDGVVTEANGLIYMRARYYSPDMRRFVNADIVAGKLSKAITLNRFAYANGNPVSYIDPFGLSAERGVIDQYVFDTFVDFVFDEESGIVTLSVDPDVVAILGTILYNPWYELYHPGQIHYAVQRYLADVYGLEKEHENGLNRYDLYSEAENSYWEVKPISYYSSPLLSAKMEVQMKRYDGDGVERGEPLGKHEMIYLQYTVKIYSYEDGKVFYTFQREKQPSEVPGTVPVPKTERERSRVKENLAEWEEGLNKIPVGNIVEGFLVAAAAAGGYMLIKAVLGKLGDNAQKANTRG